MRDRSTFASLRYFSRNSAADAWSTVSIRVPLDSATSGSKPGRISSPTPARLTSDKSNCFLSMLTLFRGLLSQELAVCLGVELGATTDKLYSLGAPGEVGYWV